jgi:hypothetical protein
MLQAPVLNVSSFFFRSMLQVCLFGCCICFTHMLQVFYLYVVYVLQWLFKYFEFFSTISDACFKCFICLQTYVANVSSICFKRRLSVAHVVMVPGAGGQRPAVGFQLLPCAFLPLLPSLPSISLKQLELARETEWRIRPHVWVDGMGGASRPGSTESQAARAHCTEQEHETESTHRRPDARV